jgi:hypothetical protein
VHVGAVDRHDLPQIGYLLLAGLLTGNEFGGWVAVHPALNTLPPPSRLLAEQAVYRRYGPNHAGPDDGHARRRGPDLGPAPPPVGRVPRLRGQHRLLRRDARNCRPASTGTAACSASAT